MPNDSLIAELTAHIVSGYVEHNPVSRSALPDLIANIGGSLAGLGHPAPEPKPEPAVDPKRSVRADYLISLEDGKKYKALKRHLSARGLTPDEYRTKWNLPAAYPMVATNYSAIRSEQAKRLGLGRKPKPTPKRGRAKKA